MKKLLFALCFMTGAAVAVNAQDTTATDQSKSQYRTQDASTQSTDANTQSTQDNTQPSTQGEDMEKQAIAASELPATITTTLESQDYSGWTVGNTYKKEKDGQTFYAVELKNGSETKMVKFDAQGNKLKEKDKDEENKDQK